MIDFLFGNDFYTQNTLALRIALSFFLSMFLVIFCGSKFIKFARSKQGKGQPIREDGPQSHLINKKGTPTMGGLLIIGSIIINTLLWVNIFNIFVLTCLAVLIIYTFVGFSDDYEKVTKQTSNAMTPKIKLLIQFTVSLISIIVITQSIPEEIRYYTKVPFFWEGDYSWIINLSWFYIPFAMVVITGSSNAVNLTDGLDGLASGLLTIAFIAFGIFCFSNYQDDVGLICISTAGACLGFLWFNTFPAKIFMGDTGSLALGALLGTVSVIIKSELFLAIIGGIFVVEALSVMIQVSYFKKTGKRIFKMAPIHHHFEQLSMHENTIVTRLWVIGIILAFIGLGAG